MIYLGKTAAGIVPMVVSSDINIIPKDPPSASEANIPLKNFGKTKTFWQNVRHLSDLFFFGGSDASISIWSYPFIHIYSPFVYFDVKAPPSKRPSKRL